MATMNSNVLACNYVISGVVGSSSEFNPKLSVASVQSQKLPVIRAQQVRVPEATKTSAIEGRRAALLGLAAAVFTAASASSANAGVIEDYLEKSKANKVCLLFYLVIIRYH